MRWKECVDYATNEECVYQRDKREGERERERERPSEGKSE